MTTESNSIRVHDAVRQFEIKTNKRSNRNRTGFNEGEWWGSGIHRNGRDVGGSPFRAGVSSLIQRRCRRLLQRKKNAFPPSTMWTTFGKRHPSLPLRLTAKHIQRTFSVLFFLHCENYGKFSQTMRPQMVKYAARIDGDSQVGIHKNHSRHKWEVNQEIRPHWFF